MESLKIMKVRENAKVPVRATGGSAGLDLCACIDEPLTIKGRGHALIPTGIAVALPGSGFAAFVYARSGLAIKHGIGLQNGVGVIDSDYRGEVCVGLSMSCSIFSGRKNSPACYNASVTYADGGNRRARRNGQGSGRLRLNRQIRSFYG